MYKGQIVPDWGVFEKMGGLRSEKACRMLTGVMQAFMLEPNKPMFRAASQAFAETADAKAASAAMQAYATAADFPTSVLDVMAKYQQTTYFDTAWEKAFKMLDLRGSNRNGFEIEDINDAMSFRVVPEGMKAKLYGMSGEKATVTLDMYGAGLSWSRRLFDDREYWTLENNAIAFRNKWWSSKAQNHIDLIDAVSAAINLAWQAVTPAGVPTTDKDYNAIRDVNTINKACETILIACMNKGYGVTPSTPFIILAPIQLKGRLTNALPIVQQPFSRSTERLYYNVTPYYSLMLSETDKYYVILPGHKLISANRMDLTLFSRFDEMSYADHTVGWGRYGAVIGDSDQLQRCATS